MKKTLKKIKFLFILVITYSTIFFAIVCVVKENWICLAKIALCIVIGFLLSEMEDTFRWKYKQLFSKKLDED